MPSQDDIPNHFPRELAEDCNNPKTFQTTCRLRVALSDTSPAGTQGGLTVLHDQRYKESSVTYGAHPESMACIGPLEAIRERRKLP